MDNACAALIIICPENPDVSHCPPGSGRNIFHQPERLFSHQGPFPNINPSFPNIGK
jgi:hypothetical protein